MFCRTRVAYNGRAAVEVEWFATDVASDHACPFDRVASSALREGPTVIGNRHGLSRKGFCVMKSKLVNEVNGQKTYVLVFVTGDEVAAGLQSFAADHHVTAAGFTAIGALEDVDLGYFDWTKKAYTTIPVREQVEVLSIIGDVSEKEAGGVQVHAHVVVGRSDGTTRGGHLLKAHVRPTLEVVLTESPAHLKRRHDPESGLALIRF
jgi:predicted DNA-binding protein with PD1-like motif